MAETTHIAMWSGPRNLSTAMMRSFGSRSDCRVMDEPFYAAYLKATGLAHPMAERIIEEGETDPQAVIAACLAPPRPPCRFSYQKHMTHHMIEGFDTGWMAQVTNVFLIREPERVLASYSAKAGQVHAEDVGFRRQRELFDQVAQATGSPPVVIDAHDISSDPERALSGLCEAIGIAFDPAMLEWEAGPRPEDGVWASHWYDSVWRSTGFAPPEAGATPALPAHLARIADMVRPDYEHLAHHRIRP